MPKSYVRLSAGRTDMSDAVQALCFLAGANSIFYGDRLLTTPNPGRSHDEQLFARLGLEPEAWPRRRRADPAARRCRAPTAARRANWRRSRAGRGDGGAPSRRARRAACVSSSTGATALAFCSNDYLGLADHPRSSRHSSQARATGASAAARRTSSAVTMQRAPRAGGRTRGIRRPPRALLFSTGYMANLAVGLSAARRGDRVLEDRLNHASLLDAGLASGAGSPAMRTATSTRCAQARRRATGQTCMVMTDGVFSMDGDVAPLRDLASPVAMPVRELFVDDAHGFGVLGANGAGSVEEAGLGHRRRPDPDVHARQGRSARSVRSSRARRRYRKPAAAGRTYIYTTALPPAVAAATRAVAARHARRSRGGATRARPR